MKDKKILLEIPTDEALVLFDLLVKFEKDRQLVSLDPAEEQALENLLATLEKSLVEPFEANYKEIISDAKKGILQKE